MSIAWGWVPYVYVGLIMAAIGFALWIGSKRVLGMAQEYLKGRAEVVKNDHKGQVVSQGN